MKTIQYLRFNYFSVFLALGMTGCGSAAFSGLNPFQAPGNVDELGQRNLGTLLGPEQSASGMQANGSDAERTALERMGTFRSAQPIEPGYPVIQPAEVRLMWIPDHLNKTGDLVPAHYYYLKVLNDRWAVQDALEYDSQLGSGGKSGSGGAVPWVYGDTAKRR
jgi:hypothetical protein